MQKLFAKCLIAAFLLTAVTAFTQTPTDLAAAKGKWKVYRYNLSHAATLSSRVARDADPGVTFDFLATPDIAYLLTSPDPSSSDLTGMKLSATIQVTGSGAFTYYGAPACGTAASVRFYFETKATGPFDPKTYWWSNATNATAFAFLTAGMNTTLTTTLDPAGWSDWAGEQASAYPAAFASALENATSMGLSFGGGCGYANGVGVPTGGPDSFILSSYTISSN